MSKNMRKSACVIYNTGALVEGLCLTTLLMLKVENYFICLAGT
jgi:hypothetical protein